MSAHVIQFPLSRRIDSGPSVATSLSATQRSQRIDNLIREIGAMYSTTRSSTCAGTMQVRNYLLVRYCVESVSDIPPERYSDAIGVLEEMRDAMGSLNIAILELRKEFERQCLGGCAPWVPWVKRKIRAAKEELPSRPDWVALAEKVALGLRR